jgi:hypothetical protein
LYFHKSSHGRPLLDSTHIREYGTTGELESDLRAHGFAILSSWTRPIAFSPLDDLFRNICRLTRSEFLSSIANSPRIRRLRRITRIKVPGYFEIGCVALRS